MRRHPAEEPVLRFLKNGLGGQEIAKKVGTTPNHVWAIRAASGIRPVSERQLEIAKTIVARKRRRMAISPPNNPKAARETSQTTPGPSILKVPTQTKTKVPRTSATARAQINYASTESRRRLLTELTPASCSLEREPERVLTRQYGWGGPTTTLRHGIRGRLGCDHDSPPPRPARWTRISRSMELRASAGSSPEATPHTAMSPGQDVIDSPSDVRSVCPGVWRALMRLQTETGEIVCRPDFFAPISIMRNPHDQRCSRRRR